MVNPEVHPPGSRSGAADLGLAAPRDPLAQPCHGQPIAVLPGHVKLAEHRLFPMPSIAAFGHGDAAQTGLEHAII